MQKICEEEMWPLKQPSHRTKQYSLLNVPASNNKLSEIANMKISTGVFVNVNI